jgi:multicomponent Na+:H+ antiporter subunit F
MSESNLNTLELTLIGAISVCVLVAMVLTTLRLWKGPQASDRVVALDIFSVAFVILSALWQLVHPESRALTVGLIVGALLFFSTLGFAIGIERGQNESHTDTRRRG